MAHTRRRRVHHLRTASEDGRTWSPVRAPRQLFARVVVQPVLRLVQALPASAVQLLDQQQQQQHSAVDRDGFDGSKLGALLCAGKDAGGGPAGISDVLDWLEQARPGPGATASELVAHAAQLDTEHRRLMDELERQRLPGRRNAAFLVGLVVVAFMAATVTLRITYTFLVVRNVWARA